MRMMRLPKVTPMPNAGEGVLPVYVHISRLNFLLLVSRKYVAQQAECAPRRCKAEASADWIIHGEVENV